MTSEVPRFFRNAPNVPTFEGEAMKTHWNLEPIERNLKKPWVAHVGPYKVLCDLLVKFVLTIGIST